MALLEKKEVNKSSNQKVLVQESYKPMFKVNLKPIAPKFPSVVDAIQIDIKYPLVDPYAFAHIYWDKQNDELVYQVEEPVLTVNEKKVLNVLEEGIKELINMSFIGVKEEEVIIEYLEKNTRVLLDELDIRISNESFLKLMYYIYRDFVGLNEIEPLMHDYFIEDIECNGSNSPIYIVHRKYKNLRTNIAYQNNKILASFVEKLAQKCGKYISYANPILDGRLPDKSRVNATYTEEISSKGPTFSIRKFTKEPWTPVHLIAFGTASPDLMAYLWTLIEDESNIMIIGGTGSGKTSLLNALAFFIPPQARIVSIEDTAELNLVHENWLPSVARAGFGIATITGEKHGEVSLFTLLKESFRQRPDYVIVGEVRGEEANVLFQGMSSIRGDEKIFVLYDKEPLRIKIRDIPNLDISKLKVLSYNRKAKKCEILPMKAFVRHPKRKKLYKITTKLGREVTVTPDHSLFTLKEDKVISIRSDELLIGTELIIPSTIPCGYNNITHLNLLEVLPNIRVYSPQYIKQASHKLGYYQASALVDCGSITDYYSPFKRGNPSAMRADKFLKLMKEAKIDYDLNQLEVRYDKPCKSSKVMFDLSDEFLRFFGYYLSEGSLNESSGNNKIMLYNSKKGILDDMRKCIYKVTGLKPRERITDRGWGSAVELAFSHKIIFELIKKYCGKKDEKRVPDFIFGLDKKRIGEFLSGLYTGDGYMSKNAVGYSTISKDLANDVTQLLLVYGIVANIKKRNRVGRKTTDYEIKFYANYKKEEFLKYVKVIGRENPLRKEGKADSNLIDDLYIDEVRSIEVLNLDKPEYVYDISVPKNQNFLGGFGSLLLHNSGHPSMGTMHAEDVGTMVRRLETPPISLSPTLVQSLDAVVIITATKVKGKNVRRVREVSEILNVGEEGSSRLNTTFKWDPMQDMIKFVSRSNVFNKIMAYHGLTSQKLNQEFRNKVLLLRRMYEQQVFDYAKVQEVINQYYKNPEKVLKRFGII